MNSYYNPQTLDNKKELLTEVDSNDNILGSVLREDCHNENLKPWHRTTHIYITNDNGELYLTKRSKYKDTAPDKLTISSGGHVRYQENPEDAARRELKEELNLDISLKFIKKYKIDYGYEREFVYVYFGKTNLKPVINKEEVEEVIPIALDVAINEFQDKSLKLSPGSRDVFELLLMDGLLKQGSFTLEDKR